MRAPQRLVLPLMTLAVVSACKGAPPKQPPPPKVQVAPAELAVFTDGVDTVSTLDSLGKVELAAQASGRIMQLGIDQGDQVNPGDLLVVLDQAQQQARYRISEAGEQTAQRRPRPAGSAPIWLRRRSSRNSWISTAPVPHIR